MQVVFVLVTVTGQVDDPSSVARDPEAIPHGRTLREGGVELHRRGASIESHAEELGLVVELLIGEIDGAAAVRRDRELPGVALDGAEGKRSVELDRQLRAVRDDAEELDGFVGFLVISKVPNTLHTPLMSGTNAIHGIVLLGGLIVLGLGAEGTLDKILLVVAIAFGTINVVGGFLVTDRMLGMFKGRSDNRKDTKR